MTIPLFWIQMMGMRLATPSFWIQTMRKRLEITFLIRKVWSTSEVWRVYKKLQVIDIRITSVFAKSTNLLTHGNINSLYSLLYAPREMNNDHRYPNFWNLMSFTLRYISTGVSGWVDFMEILLGGSLPSLNKYSV
ncbi:hypothetical protein K435DRAFT_811162 [Dendrothele bispora CBS 962.96]|uniref:Uncharacterized protein n=1 Tax=Dendrothele bispora (strain CBS 962.96) TaxID=1314807 RepID=A0A4S8KTX8_DENBC|nr:hypothetical protein K435DRAFT_811162 [Dendrothele bispora CBS 962.96]